jgi:hypothetical protein
VGPPSSGSTTPRDDLHSGRTIILAVLVLVSFGVHLGRAIANVLAGCDWRFPSRVNLFTSLPAVLRGDAGAGLVDLRGPVGSPSSLLMCIGTTELILLTTTVLLIKLGWDRWGPGRTRGVATGAEAERLLGVARFAAEPQDHSA